MKRNGVVARRGRKEAWKSAVARPQERKFLGFSFTGQVEPRRRIAPKAVKRFKERVREITRRKKGEWNKGRRRFDELHERGVDRQLAANTAGRNHVPWRMSLSIALSQALSNAYFDSIGLPKLVLGR